MGSACAGGTPEHFSLHETTWVQTRLDKTSNSDPCNVLANWEKKIQVLINGSSSKKTPIQSFQVHEIAAAHWTTASTKTQQKMPNNRAN